MAKSSLVEGRAPTYVAALASLLEQAVEGRFGVGSERLYNGDQWRSDARRILANPNVTAIRALFYNRALADALAEADTE